MIAGIQMVEILVMDGQLDMVQTICPLDFSEVWGIKIPIMARQKNRWMDIAVAIYASSTFNFLL